MDVKNLLESLDAQVLRGDILGAFDQFFANDVRTLSGPHDVTNTKSQKVEMLRWFLGNVANVNRIERSATAINDNVTESQFLFDFTDRNGNPLVFNEVIRRTWQDGQVIEEYYLLNGTIAPAKTASKIAAPKSDIAAAPKKADAPKPAPAKAAPAAAKAAPAPKTAATSKDDLTKIEGIGPKIAELLNKAGFHTFADVAKSKLADLKAVLDAAGSRFQMHDPSTWAKQAGLARDGKTAELAKLQAELKGGK